ncbi:MAG: LamG domain-containing protein, partial [Akkermansiaceae bacterium]|nr:LamG domain-containing protein [Akkermansiaceae bacterium]
FQNKAITIGANNAGAEKTAADIAEVLVYNRALDETEQTAVGHYLGAKYEIDGEWNPA